MSETATARVSNEERSCTGKSGSWENARAAREYAANVFVSTGEILYEYRCPYCDCYHVGHPRDFRPLATPGDWEKVDRAVRQAEARHEAALAAVRKECKATVKAASRQARESTRQTEYLNRLRRDGMFTGEID